ncbi:MAG: 2-amino-4-hydroxy-6-hydroxymethyldihydropteridine diphosphokinase [Anaeromyxobacteraceae bacterium]
MRAYVSVGTNLGDRWAHLALAARALRATPGVAVVRASRVYETAPMGPPQPSYLNAVLALETTLPPERLLAALQAVEHAALRRREVRWGPRTLDLDLLLHGEATLGTPTLTLPHPGLALRRFVLAPLAELAPDLAVPGDGRTVAALLAVAPPHDLSAVGAYPL